MEQIFNQKKQILNKLFFCLLFVLLSISIMSCGLDVFYILEPPDNVVLPADNELSRVFSFRTNDTGNSSMDIFIGTSVYYKIYNNLSSLLTDQMVISNSNTQYSDNGFNKILSLGYQQLNLSMDLDPLVAKSTINQSVEIRLFTEGSGSNPYLSGIKVSGNYLMKDSSPAIPLRIDNKTFEFYNDNMITYQGSSEFLNSIPLESETDVKYSSSFTTADCWYVNAYAVSVGRTNTFTLKHSQLTSLGYIIISKSSF